MLKTRIIPTLLWKDVGLVKGIGFDSSRRIGSALPAIKVFNTREVDELILVDITASQQGRTPDLGMIRELSSHCFVPFTVGGGIKTVEDVRGLLRSGADKVSVCTTILERPEIIGEIAAQFGSQALVASIDARRTAGGGFECFTHSGTKGTGRDVVAWAREVEERGAGEILLTSVENDGAMVGYDLELIRRVAAVVTIPIIASGGAGNYDHMHQALQAGASAVAAAAIFQFTEQTPLEAKHYLAERGVAVRRGNHIS